MVLAWVVLNDVLESIVGSDNNRYPLILWDEFDFYGWDESADFQRVGFGVLRNRFDACSDQFILRISKRYPHDVTGFQKSCNVFGKFQHSLSTRRLVDTHVVERQRSALQTLREYVDRRILPLDELTVAPDQAVHFRHRLLLTSKSGLTPESLIRPANCTVVVDEPWFTVTLQQEWPIQVHKLCLWRK